MSRCRWCAGRIQTLESRVTTIEGIQLKVAWYEEIDTQAGVSGQFSPPTGGTILLGQLDGSGDVLVSELDGTSEYPTYVEARTAGGAVITATLDADGNWTVSGVATSQYVALIYIYRVTVSSFDRTTALEYPDIEDYNPGFVAITGGTIDGTVIGGATPAAGDFTTVTATGLGTFASLDISGAIDVDGTSNLDNTDIDGSLVVDNSGLVANFTQTGATAAAPVIELDQDDLSEPFTDFVGAAGKTTGSSIVSFEHAYVGGSHANGDDVVGPIYNASGGFMNSEMLKIDLNGAERFVAVYQEQAK